MESEIRIPEVSLIIRRCKLGLLLGYCKENNRRRYEILYIFVGISDHTTWSQYSGDDIGDK